MPGPSGTHGARQMFADSQDSQPEISSFKGGMWNGAVVGYKEMTAITFFLFHGLSHETHIPKALTWALSEIEAEWWDESWVKHPSPTFLSPHHQVKSRAFSNSKASGPYRSVGNWISGENRMPTCPKSQLNTVKGGRGQCGEDPRVGGADGVVD